MAKLRKCSNCGRDCLSRRRALVRGKMRDVCAGCSSRALRVCTDGTAPCLTPACAHVPRHCAKCFAEAVERVRRAPFDQPIAALKAMIRGIGLASKGMGADEHVQGIIEGLEKSLALLGSEKERLGQ